jgi:molybdopterin-guanine dinucleotide biosynthesis protein A
MPFLNVDLLRYIAGLAPGFDVVIPRSGKQVEPLHALYSKDCIGPIEACLMRGNCRVADVLPAVKVRYVEPDEIDRFDPQHLSFFNVNSEADLERARAILEGDLHDKR